MSERSENLTYEEALSELEQILEALRGEQVSMDELVTRNERAAQLIAYCRGKLRDIEAKLAHKE